MKYIGIPIVLFHVAVVNLTNYKYVIRIIFVAIWVSYGYTYIHTSGIKTVDKNHLGIHTYAVLGSLLFISNILLITRYFSR